MGKCMRFYAAPVFASWHAHERSNATRTWAVSRTPVQSVLCAPSGGLCGLVAFRAFRPWELDRFRRLIIGAASDGTVPLQPLPTGTALNIEAMPAMVLLVDPRDYFAGKQKDTVSAMAILGLVSTGMIFTSCTAHRHQHDLRSLRWFTNQDDELDALSQR